MAGAIKTAVNVATSPVRAGIGLGKAVATGSLKEGGEAFQRGALKGPGASDFPSPGGAGFVAGGKAGAEKTIKALGGNVPGATAPSLESPAQTDVKFESALKSKPRRGGSVLTERSSSNPFPFISR